jgi:hypothetical protein
MDNEEAIAELLDSLYMRVAGYENALKAIREKTMRETLLRHEISSLAVNQAQIGELEYVIQHLSEILSRMKRK